MDAISLLKREHRDVEDLFDRLSTTDDEHLREELFRQLALELTLHTVVEEQYFYPALRASETGAHVQALARDHDDIKSQLAELLALEVDDESFPEGLQGLADTVERHVAEEEQELFSSARRLWDAETLEALGDQMRAAREAMREADPLELVNADEVQFPSMT
jgi:hemerythrin superfamily protein